MPGAPTRSPGRLPSAARRSGSRPPRPRWHPGGPPRRRGTRRSRRTPSPPRSASATSSFIRAGTTPSATAARCISAKPRHASLCTPRSDRVGSFSASIISVYWPMRASSCGPDHAAPSSVAPGTAGATGALRRGGGGRTSPHARAGGHGSRRAATPAYMKLRILGPAIEKLVSRSISNPAVPISVSWIAVDVAAPGDPLLDAVPAVLAARDLRIVGEAVFQEEQPPSRPQDAPHLAQRRVDVGDRAERPRAEGVVDRGVVERDLGPVETDELHGHRRRGEPLRRELAADERGVDRVHLLDLCGVVGHVRAAAEAELHHRAGEPLQRPLPQRAHPLVAEREVDEARQDLVFVEAHGHESARWSR